MFRFWISLSLMFGQSLLIDITLNSFLPLLSGFFVFFTSISIPVILFSTTNRVFLALFSMHAIHRMLVLVAPKNFTLAESCILSSIVSLLGLFQISQIINYSPESVLPADNHTLQSGLLVSSVFLSTILAYPILLKVLQYYDKSNARRHFGFSLLFYATFVSSVLAMWYYTSTTLYHINPILWFFEFVFQPDHFTVIYWWLNCLAMIALTNIPFVSRHITHAFQQLLLTFPHSWEKLLLDIKRKSFHLVAVLMFIPAIIYTPDLLSLAYAVAFSLFYFIELMRIFRVWIPFLPSHSIDLFLRQFIESAASTKSKTDEQLGTPYPDEDSAQFFRSWDLGPLILSHFYLLLACSFPLWITSSITNLTKPQMNALSASGVIVIGIGDTFAAIAGHMVGHHKWPERKKSYEGTLAFIISTFVVYVILDGHDWGLYVAVCAIAAVLEAVSYQNDNLVLSIWACSFTCMLMNV